jgi:hypothetical protein
VKAMVLGFYKRKNVLGRKMIATCLDAGEFDVFGKLREHQLLVFGRRGEGARLADALVYGFLFSIHQIDCCAVELVPYLLVRFGQGGIDPGLIVEDGGKRGRTDRGMVPEWKPGYGPMQRTRHMETTGMASGRSTRRSTGKRGSGRTVSAAPGPETTKRPATERQMVDFDPWGAFLEQLMETPEEEPAGRKGTKGK